MRRPTTNGAYGSYVTTPRSATYMSLLGAGFVQGGVALTRDEYRAINRLYGYTPEKPQTKPEAQALMQAGADRNAMRHAECDGLRLLAWIAKYVPPGDDPLRNLVQLAIDAGWDVDPADVEWARQEESEAA